MEPNRQTTGFKLEVWHNILWSSYKAGVLSELANIANENGVDLTIFQIAENEVQRKGLPPVDLSRHRYPMILLFKGAYEGVPLWRRIWALGRQAATTRADVTVLAGYHRVEYILQALILRLRGKHTAVFCDSTGYDQPPTPWKNWIKRVVFPLCRYVFCYGERAKEYATSFGIKPENAFTRCQAAALPPSYDPQAVPAAREASAPVDQPLFLYVGRLLQLKSLDVLLRAFARARATMPGARLRLVGAGPEEGALRALAAELGCTDAVDFAGAQGKEQLFANYTAATCLLLTSHSEAWGLVVNEALHYGCPVIVSHRCGCVPELVANSSCGMVTEWGNEDDLTEKLLAAPALWADKRKVAQDCLAQIAPFSPRNAAQAIMDGVITILAR